MCFNPGLNIGQVVAHNQIVDIFQCGNMGGMRRSHTTNTLVIISDYTKGLYLDKWIGDTLHYTGMGMVGDQDLNWAQNATLAESNSNGVEVHLFEVVERHEYIYCGRVELVGTPYTATQPDDNGNNRLVWIFPVKPIHAMTFPKPTKLVFSDMQDYQKRGKEAEQEYIRQRDGLAGRRVMHKTNGMGTAKKFDGKMITIQFDNGETKQFDYALCTERQLLQIV